ncbi:hypothetical protein RclHR1_16110002 [Rhizophagus clarus]|uniref:UvrD-like helicase C-terminal domain-containing protein n=1 Tax=Rhizophagus clarus TaxID=94130 RepID=A0A2Z6R9Q2_9GLOM|nr:hypothetical protein RclHR1_16110002 [Rhizophagus clarus]
MVACSRLQIPLSLVWAITVHKSQGLILPKAVIDLGNKEYAASLSFIAVSRISALKNILFKPFSFERLQQIRTFIGDHVICASDIQQFPLPSLNIQTSQ